MDAWGEISDIGALDNILGGIKGVMGEVAAREKIAESYRRGRTGGEVLLVAPQIFDGNMLERSDAIVARVEGDDALTIVKAWEVVTDGSARAHAGEQMKGSLAEYRKGGVVLRRHDGRVAQFRNVTVLDSVGEIYVAQGDGMDAALAGVREGLITELGMDLVTERVRGKFSPSYEEFAQILKEEDGAERLIELLGGDREGLKRQVVAGTIKRRGKICGLRVVSEEKAESLSSHFFCLGFENVAGNRKLVSAFGTGSLALASAWVSGRIGREIDVVEKSNLAGLLGTRSCSRNNESDLTVEAVVKHIKENGVARLLEIAAVVGKSPNRKDEMVVVGCYIQSSGKIFGLHVISEEEAESLSKYFFCLGFESAADNRHLVSASGMGSLVFASAWVSGQIKRELDVVEKSYLARLLGTVRLSQNKETDLTADVIVKHLREHGLTRLLEIAAIVDKFPDWEDKIVVIGYLILNKNVTGFRVVSEEEAEKLPRRAFRLFFERVDGVWRLVSAGDKGGKLLKEKIERSDERAPRSESGSASVDAMTFGAVFLAGMLAKSAKNVAGRIGRIMKSGRQFGNTAPAASGISSQFAGSPSFACAADVYIPFGMQGGMAPPVPMMPMFVHGMI